ncbi:MAG TPA: hypothetical protein VE955_05300 [Candidatus Dormibacteraeota bacterium]|nr:hypothetical protein [Candidatus Dormibacteraeota bacterium]
MDIGTLTVSVIGIVLTIVLVYCGLKTLKLFKANVAARAWTYISLSAMFFAMGVGIFIIEALIPMGLLSVGGVLQAVGGVFLVLD